MNLCFKKGSLKKVNAPILFFIIAFFTVSGILYSSAWAGEPTDTLKGTLNKIIKALNDPELKKPEKKIKRREILVKLVKERFDEEEFARRVLKSHWKKRTDEEKQEFIILFSYLLEKSYFEKIDAYLEKAENFSEKNIVYLKETIKGNYAVVATKIITGNGSIEVPVHYRLKNTQCNWLVCDIAIEGVSIVINYRTQFNEILANSTFQELLEKLRSKQASAPAGNGEKKDAQ